jgi:hypothetical protein
MKQIVWMLLAVSAGAAQRPSIDDIMARVAANQAKSVDARNQFVYRQQELVSLRYTNGKVQCEDRREFTVAPGPIGAERQLVKSANQGGSSCSVHVALSSGENVDVNTDDAKAESFNASFGKTSDGIPRDLFPLTAREQRLYEYRLEGTEAYRERQVYRIGFRPNHQRDADGDEGYWKGTTLIDATEFEPLQVVTTLTAKIPGPVRILLGTNLKGVGFSVSYQRVADGVWFPASFGGEFELRALFFIKRSISINVKNSGFQRTNVNSKVAFDEKQ